MRAEQSNSSPGDSFITLSCIRNDIAGVLYEVTPGGEIVWTWHAHEHLDPDIFTITPQDHRHEWTHGNTVGELADGNIIVSFRNISTVAIADRRSQNRRNHLDVDVLAQQHFPNELANGNKLSHL